MTKPTLRLLAVLPLFMASCATTPSSPAEESYVRTNDGTLLAFQRYGSGGDALIVPGMSFLSADTRFLAKGRTVIFYDMRGRGRSDQVYARTLEEDVADLEDVRKWFELERFSLLATDYRATVAAHYAALNPNRVEKLAIISPVPLAREPYWDVFERMYNDGRDTDAFRQLSLDRRQGKKRADPQAWNAAFTKELYRPMFQNPSNVGRMQSVPFAAPNDDPERAVRSYLTLLRSFGDWRWNDVVEKITCPVLVVHGVADPLPEAAAREWVDAIQGAKIASIDGSGRLPWIEKKRAFESAIASFLD